MLLLVYSPKFVRKNLDHKNRDREKMSLVSALLGAVAGRIRELLLEKARLLYDVEEEVRNLEHELHLMISFLQGMNDPNPDTPQFLTIKELLKIAYDVEDLIESYIFERGFSHSEKDGFIERYVCFSVSVSRNRTLIEAIKARIERIKGYYEQKQLYAADLRVRRRNRVERYGFRGACRYNYFMDNVVGLEEDINKLVGVVTADETQIEVVSIVGMCGSGKTTLAIALYNHECVENHFICRAWVSVSKECVAEEILFRLLIQVDDRTMRMDEALGHLDVIVGRLQWYLKGRRYLIVLDNVWKMQVLRDILSALPSANGRRKIIITTRNREVTDFLNLKCIIHEPGRLSEKESWELFRKIVLTQREESCHSTDMTLLEASGKEMLKTCGGLPLAVVALANILGKKETIDKWKEIKKAGSSLIMEDWEGVESYGPVKENLELSYDDLPSELKPCFLYLANFLKGCEIEVEQLIRMWIAEGFITSYKLDEEDTLEDVARGYLDELIQRSMVQITSKNYDGMVSSICIHDLVGDLCITEAKQQEFAKIFTLEAPDAKVMESRRATISPYNGVNIPLPKKSQPLRSLIYNGFRNEYCQNLDLQLIHQNFRLLRVLLLHCIGSSDGNLPTEIGSLIHLRYLGLRRIKITELPPSIGNLCNLQTLHCSGMYRLNTVRIPDVFCKIEGLRHLEIDCAQPLNGKLKLHTLKSLQTLSGIKGGDWMLEELPLLSRSVQNLYVNAIATGKQLEAAFECPSIKIDCLHSLALDWEMKSTEGHGVVILKNFGPIIHCQHLGELRLVGRIEDRLAGCDIQFPNCIKKLVLWNSGFEAVATLAALGKLPRLIILQLGHESYVGTKWTCFAGEFPQLKELLVRGLPNLREWNIEKGAMPQLSHLTVQICKKLRKLPAGLKFITDLQELTLRNMSVEFNKRVKGVDGNGGEDAHIIQHVPIIRF